MVETLPPRPAGFEASTLAYVRGQVEELLTRYGHIDVIWFDGRSPAITPERIRELQPHIVINDRLLPAREKLGDFITFETRAPESRPEGWWEYCDIWPVGPWGYVADAPYKSTGWVLSRLALTRGWGGNLLMNVGPGPTGELPEAYYARQAELAAWMAHSAESLFGVAPGPYPERASVPTTIRGHTWYLHVTPEAAGQARVTGVELPRSVRLLRTGGALPFGHSGDTLLVEIPESQCTELDDVAVVEW